MNKKAVIKTVFSLMIALFIFTTTGFLGNLFIMRSLGSTTFAVSAPLALPLQLLAGVSAFFIPNRKSAEDDSEEYAADEEYQYSYTPLESVASAEAADMSEYPEFAKTADATEAEASYHRPDISSIIAEQKCSVSTEASAAESSEDPLLEDYLSSASLPQSDPADPVYYDLPTELPEDYTPYAEAEDEDGLEDEKYGEEEEEEEEYDLHAAKLILRCSVSLICSLLAIFLPFNVATVYTPDSITVRRPFKATEYSLYSAESYTVGVKLSGNISIKAEFENGKEIELVIPEHTIRSSSFKESYSSPYEYAAFCDRLMERSGIEKRKEGLNSFVASPALSDEDLAYIRQITGIDPEENKK